VARSPTTRSTRCAPSHAHACRAGVVNGRHRLRSARGGWRRRRPKGAGRWCRTLRT
jgi:hypothetical protein